MNGILGMAQLLGMNLQGENKELVDIVLNSGKTLLTIINDILDLSRIEAGKVKLSPEKFVQRTMPVPTNVLFRAWTEEFDLWFASPGSVMMKGKVNTAFYFETSFAGKRHLHYGRFLRLEPNRLVELTWLTGPDGTKGAETVMTVELKQNEDGTLLRLTHEGFLDEESKNNHEQAWPMVLAQLEEQLSK